MSASDLVPSTKRFLRQGDVAFNRPNSESVQFKMAGSVNYLLDRVFLTHNFRFNGIVAPTTASPAHAGILHLPKASTLIGYYVSLASTGLLTGDVVVNFDVYDADGVFVDTIFGTSGANRLLINSQGIQNDNLVFGRDLALGTNFTVNLEIGSTRQLGEMVLTQFGTGSIVIPKIISGTTGAVNMIVSMRIQEDV